MEQENTQNSLHTLIKYVEGIPDRIQKRLTTGNGMDEDKMRSWIAEELQKQVRRVRFYNDKRNHETESCFAHYTSWSSFLAILNQERPLMRMYNYETANDPQEGQIYPEGWREVGERARCIGDVNGADDRSQPGDTYGCSFSSGTEDIGDDLTLWRLYGDNGEGCSLMTSSPGMDMYRIRYRKHDGSVRNRKEAEEDKAVAQQMNKLLCAGERTIDSLDDSYMQPVGSAIGDAVQRVLEGYCYLVKDVAYSNEKEWRRIVVRPPLVETRFDADVAGVRRYVEGHAFKDLLVTGSAITIGPKVGNSKAVCDYVKRTAGHRGLQRPSIRNSAKSYR